MDYILHKSLSLREVNNSKIDEMYIRSSFHKKNVISRYCNQNAFDFLLGGGYDKLTTENREILYKVNGKDLFSFKLLNKIKGVRVDTHAVYSKGHVYLFGGYGENSNYIFKCSLTFKSLEKVGDICDKHEHENYCSCAFMNKIYFIGGTGKHRRSVNYCMEFDTKDYKWKKIARMNEARGDASCTVFEGRLVVTGGWDNHNLNTVEVYDHIADECTYMPRMLLGKNDHKSLAIRNKLYVIEPDIYDGTGFEVYDSICKKFMSIQVKTTYFGIDLILVAAFSIGNKIVIFNNRSEKVCYDTDTDEWSEELYFVSKKYDNLNLILACVLFFSNFGTILKFQ